jgi:hypothetical protein
MASLDLKTNSLELSYQSGIIKPHAKAVCWKWTLVLLFEASLGRQ